MSPFDAAWTLLKKDSEEVLKFFNPIAALKRRREEKMARNLLSQSRPPQSEPPRQNTSEWMKYHGMDNPDSQFNLAVDLHRNSPHNTGGFNEMPFTSTDENDLQYLVNQNIMTPEEADALRSRAALSMIGPDPEMPLE